MAEIESPSRRRLLLWLSVGMGALATLAVGVPILGYLLGIVRRPRDEWLSLGKADVFPVGETRFVSFLNPHTQPWDGLTARTGAYVRRIDEATFQVFAVNCAHLGCPVSWFPQSGLFLCPCHGGVYYADGQRASGPPPRGLFAYDTELRAGELYIKAGHLPTLQDTLKDEDA